MDTIKNLISKDKDPKEEDTAGPTGKLTGEGSHFGSDGTPQFGAVPGVGISSFTEGQNTSTSTSTAAPAATSTTTAAHDAALTSTSAAPQLQQPDFGERLAQPTAGTNPAADPEPTSSTSVPAVTSTGITGATLVDRSVPAGNSATVAQPYTERAFPLSGSTTTTAGHHPTFTGERLDETHATHAQGQPFSEPGAVLTDTTNTSTQHHTSRDAAVIGSVGTAAAATGAHEHEKHEQEKNDHEKQEHEKSGKGLAGIFGLGKKKDKEESTTTDPTTKTDSEHHKKHHGEQGAAAVGGAAVVGTAAAHETHEHDKEGDEVGEKKKHGLLGSLFHRDNPSKLQKDPPSREPIPAAHETFVKPGVHHTQHIGIDGPIGRRDQVSGVAGTDARYPVAVDDVPKDLELKPAPVAPTLHERADAAPEGIVIEPRTGLPMNVGKFGAGAGGTDGATQIAGYDEKLNEERMVAREAELLQNQEVTWDKITGERTGAPDNPVTFAEKVNENTSHPPAST